jgi:hypothetical protein
MSLLSFYASCLPSNHIDASDRFQIPTFRLSLLLFISLHFMKYSRLILKYHSSNNTNERSKNFHHPFRFCLICACYLNYLSSTTLRGRGGKIVINNNTAYLLSFELAKTVWGMLPLRKGLAYQNLSCSRAHHHLSLASLLKQQLMMFYTSLALS